MAYININRENTDQFYRYKMPSLIAKVEGKGNGIKTVIVNMVEIGKALQRPPSYPCKYFGCELGAQTQMDIKIGRYIVNGAHEATKLQDLLDGFIKHFVLCEECDNPETTLLVQPSKGRIGQVCQACGHNRIVDTRHKLTTYILKNPPNHEEGTHTGKKGDKKGQKKRQKGSKDKEPVSPTTATNNDDHDEFNGFSVKDDDDDEDWSMDTSKEAVKLRQTSLTEGASALTLTDDLDKSVAERVNIFFKFVEKIKRQGGVANIASSLAKIKAEAERLEVMDNAASIMAEHLYGADLLTQVKEYRAIMLHFVVNNKKAQKNLLGAFEILVGKDFPELMPRVPHILKAFYDNDILEEDVILDWNDKVSKKHVNKETAKEIRDKAKPVIDWLRTAEEESSESENEDEDVEVVYSQKAESSGITVVSDTPTAPQTNSKGEGEEQEDDDINEMIDAI